MKCNEQSISPNPCRATWVRTRKSQPQLPRLDVGGSPTDAGHECTCLRNKQKTGLSRSQSGPALFVYSKHIYPLMPPGSCAAASEDVLARSVVTPHLHHTLPDTPKRRRYHCCRSEKRQRRRSTVPTRAEEISARLTAPRGLSLDFFATVTLARASLFTMLLTRATRFLEVCA